MGLRSPFGYVGFERRFAETMCGLLDSFCRGCHTEDDFKDGCRGCPIGVLIYAAKDYVLDAYEGNPEATKRSKPLQKKYRMLRDLKRAIRPIEPYPTFNAQWIYDEDQVPDVLGRVRKILSDMKFHEDYVVHPFALKTDDEYILWAMRDYDKELAKKIGKRAKEIRARREREREEAKRKQRKEAGRMKRERRGFRMAVMTPEEAMEYMKGD